MERQLHEETPVMRSDEAGRAGHSGGHVHLQVTRWQPDLVAVSQSHTSIGPIDLCRAGDQDRHCSSYPGYIAAAMQ